MSEFDKYIVQGEPDKQEKAKAWQTAIGLQDVDGLKPSEYLIKTAMQHIEGDLTIGQVKDMLDSYYQTKGVRENLENERTEEADKVSARITEILSEQSFSFTPDYYLRIHRRLFEGIYEHAGQLRTVDITKKEWVLNGDTVLYTSHDMLRETLEYDFAQEKKTDYKTLNADMAMKHICNFISGIWQIHPFREGNTRTTAVFTMKYLKTFGFPIDNEVFKDNSWYFRNALVRANYKNFPKGIFATTEYLEQFFRNLIFGEKNQLSNRSMLVNVSQSATTEISKSQNGTLDGTLNCTLEELALLKYLKDNPNAKQTDIAKHLEKSERTIKRMTPSLIERGLLERENGKRNGKWIVKCELH
ncbi:Fic family protein [uncultured Bacteroides sp.]|uniref:Fic family protein n=1 Tax=uncultured Bacteroides sp. TaxID=162156 RepID=UPI00263641DC|nr:Fic family protein [uncultured Bacteroides sp.]